MTVWQARARLARGSLVAKLALLRGVLNGGNEYLIRVFIDGVINQVAVFPGDDLAHAFYCLRRSGPGKQSEQSNAIEDGSADAFGPLRAAGPQIGRNGSEIRDIP